MQLAGRSWCETYGEFSDWLTDAGMTVDGLPQWPATRPVRVLALAGPRLFVERIGQREYRKFKRMADRGQERLRAIPIKQIANMHEVRITDVDANKLRTWRVNNDYCN